MKVNPQNVFLSFRASKERKGISGWQKPEYGWVEVMDMVNKPLAHTIKLQQLSRKGTQQIQIKKKWELSTTKYSYAVQEKILIPLLGEGKWITISKGGMWKPVMSFSLSKLCDKRNCNDQRIRWTNNIMCIIYGNSILVFCIYLMVPWE